MPADETHPTKLGAWTLVFGALLVGAGLVVIWAPPILPGLDTPHNLVAAWIAAHPDRYARWFEPNWPLAVIVHRVVLSASFHAASPFVALKIARSVELVAMGLGALALVRRVGASASVVVPLSVAACFGWFHLMGYLNFTFAAALVPWALACLRDRPTRVDGLLLTLCTLLVVETHTFVGAGLAAILAVAGLCHRHVDRPADPAAARAASLAALPSLGVVALTVILAAPSQPEIEARSTRPTTLAEDLAALPQNVFGGYSPLGAPLAALAVVAAVLWLWSERRARTVRWWVGLLSLASIVGYFVAPLDGFGWVFLKPRFALFPFLVAAMPARLPPLRARALGAAAIAIVTAHLAFFGVRSAAAGRRVAEVVASFGRDAPGVMLPVVFDGRDGQEPKDNLGALTYAYAYALLNGPGAAPLLFAQNPVLHHALLSPELRSRVPARPSPWAYRSLLVADPALAARRRQKLVDRAATTACTVDSVVVIGATADDRAKLEARGVRFIHPGLGRPACARGTLRIDRARPVPLRVRIGFAETDIWPVDGVLDTSLAGVEAQIPSGTMDIVVCAAGAEPCVPGGRTLVERRLTLAPGATFAEAVQVP
jgi:hypothetical protein